VYFTWEGETGALAEAGVDVPAQRAAQTVDEVGVELRVLERMLSDANHQLARVKDLIEEAKRLREGGSDG
jgi:hypothetical protein